jgi:hypothetical protein
MAHVCGWLLLLLLLLPVLLHCFRTLLCTDTATSA